MSFPQVGQILPNGHTVDAAYCVGDARYVLAHRDGQWEQYVVWSVDQDGDTVNGRYFSDPAAAQKKFAECCFDWWPEVDVEYNHPSNEDIGYLRKSAKRAISKKTPATLDSVTNKGNRMTYPQLTAKFLYCLGWHYNILLEFSKYGMVANSATPCATCKYVLTCNHDTREMESALFEDTGVLVSHARCKQPIYFSKGAD